MEEQKKLNVDLATLKPIEAKGGGLMDFSPLHNKLVKIEKADVILSTVGWDKAGNQIVLAVPREQLLLESENIVPKLGDKKSDAEYRVREWFNLVKQADGSLGWSLHEKGKLNKFLKAQRVSKPSELVGKEVMVKVVDKKNSEGQTESRIYFLY